MAEPYIADLKTDGLGAAGVAVRAVEFDGSVETVLMPSVGEYPVYDPDLYKAMTTDRLRNAAYRAAIDRAAPGRTVVDIGTGQDALWAIEAARCGARHVHAIEVMPESAAKAREAVRNAGVQDRVTVHEGLSTEIDLPTPADVCVSEIIGTIGGSEGAAKVLCDARERLVKPGGFMIPFRCVTTVAAVDLGGLLPPEGLAFGQGALGQLERIFASVGRPFDVRLCLYGMDEKSFVSEQAEVESLEFGGELASSGTDHRELTVTRAGRVHGFALGIRLWVSDRGAPIDSVRQFTNWGPVLAPVSMEGVPVEPGDRLAIDFAWTTSDDLVHPDYRLTGRAFRAAPADAVDLRWDSPHHAGGFRATDVHRLLFPDSAS